MVSCVWHGGRRAEADRPTDGRIKAAAWGPFGRLFDWTRERVLSFIAEHGIPYNPLHDQGFVSIGCAPCTRAIRAGEPERAGRWWWEQERKECGLHSRHITQVPAPAQFKDFPKEVTP